MALAYRDVQDMYDQLHKAGAVTASLPEWSQQMNQLTGTNMYDEGLHANLIKRASVGLDKLIEATGVPQYGAEFGRSVGELVGNPAAGESVGRGLGRGFVNFAPLLIPGAGIPATAARLGLTGLLSGAGAYTETGSPAAGVISGATAAALPKVADVAGQFALSKLGGRLVEGKLANLSGDVLDQVKRYFPETLPQKVGEAVAGQLGAAATMQAGQAAEQEVSGQPLTSPFTTENLLNLTLGQAPFAAVHLGGRALGLGKTPAQHADILQKAIDVSKPLIELKTAKDNIDAQTPIEKIPTVEPTTETSPKVIAETQSLLSQIRGEQVKVKNDPNLTPEDKVNKINDLLQREASLQQQKKVPTVGDTVLGNSILPDTPRQDVIGKEVRRNRDGTWRAILVSDDPSNPEELRGKVVSYSTKNEPNPVYGAQSQQTGEARFSLPDQQWQTVKSQDEWNARFKKPAPVEGTPELPVQPTPMSAEELSAHLNELNTVEAEVTVAQTPADIQQAVVHLNDVQQSNDLPQTNDTILSRTANMLVKSGQVEPQDVAKTAVAVEAKRTAKKLSAREQERAVPPLSPQATADITAQMGGEGFSVRTLDKLSHAKSDDIDTKPISDLIADHAFKAIKTPESVQAFKKWPGRADTTLPKDASDFVDIVESFGATELPYDKVAKFLNERSGTSTWDANEVKDFMNRPHVKLWTVGLNNSLENEQNIHASPVVPAVINIMGRKGLLLQQDDVGKLVANFTKGKSVVDAFGGSGQLSGFAKDSGATSVTMNVKNPQMFELFNEIKTNPDDFANRVAEAVKPIVSSRDLSVPQIEGGGDIKAYLNKIEQTDPLVALFIKQNLNARGREVVGSSFSPTKTMATDGLLALPTRIRRFAWQIDNISNADGWDTVANAQAGERVMVDPPYVGTKKGMYADVEGVTTEQQLQNYEKFLYPAAERGAQFVVFDISDPALINSLKEHGFSVQEVSRQARGGSRVQPEFIATNTPEIGQVSAVREPTAINNAINELQKLGYTTKKNFDGSVAVVNKNGTPAVFKSGSREANLANIIRLGGEAPVSRYALAQPYVPSTPEETALVGKLGLDKGGVGLNNFLINHPNPFLQALGKDLSKFQDSLGRVDARIQQIDGGAYASTEPGGRMTITLSDGNLLSGDNNLGLSVAHELVHGLTKLELDNPTKVSIVNKFTDLRKRLVDALPTKMRIAYDAAQNEGWYDKYSRGEKPFSALGAERGLTHEQSQIVYGLLDNHELVAQTLSRPAMRQYLQSVPAEGGGTWYSRFTNLVKSLLGIGEKIPNTAFEEFLSHTDQLMEQGNYVASFRNFANRYFSNLGQSDRLVDYNTRRALGIVLDSAQGMEPGDIVSLLRFGLSGRSSEYQTAVRDVTKMFTDRSGDDAQVTFSVLNELGYTGDPGSLANMVDDLMLNQVPNHSDALDLMPEPVSRFVFEYMKDARDLLSVVRAATLENNKGVLNIADPSVLRGPVKWTLGQIEKVLAVQKVHEQALTDMQGLSSVPPDGFYDKMSSRPSLEPEWATGATQKENGRLWKFLEPIGQWARRVPEVAEAVSKGWQLNANSRKMASEALKAFGTDLTTMELSKESVKATENILKQPKLTNAVNKWIWTNQKFGKEANAVAMLDSDHPEIQKVLATLNPQQRDQVEEIVQKHQISQQQMQSEILEKMLQIASTRGAEVVGGKVKDGVALSSALLEALKMDRNDPNSARAADAQIKMVQDRLQPEPFLKLLKYSQGEIEKWNLWQKFYQENPAWSSGQRYGKFLLTYVKGNRTFLAGVDSKKEANQIAEGGRITKFEKNQKAEDDLPPALGPDSVGLITRLRELEQNQFDMLRNTGRFTQDDVAQMRKWSPVEQLTTEEAYRGGVPQLTPQARGLTKGAEELPWLRNHFSWIQKTGTYWSRQLLRAQAHAQLLDPEVAQNPDLQSQLKTHYENILTPDSKLGGFFQKSAMNWFMGFNPASAIINATQPFLTHTAELTALTGKPIDSYRRVINALSEVANGGLKGSWKTADHEWLIHKASQDGELDYSMFDDQAAAQESIHTNYKRIMNGERSQSLGQRLGTMAGSWSTAGMWMFKGVERINNMAALLASFDHYSESQPNLSRDEIYAKAVEFNHAVNYGGGRAQRPVGIFAGRGAFPRTAAMLATSMQSYVLGTTFQLARYIQKGFFRPEGLAPNEVYAARKAAVQMLGVQLASAGVLGLPFVSGAIALLDKAFPDLEVRGHLQTWMHDILGGDQENGSILSDVAMMGAPSMMGWDLQSRLSMGNTVPGVSEINGFDPELLLGAPANLVSTFVKGGQKLAQGDFAGALDNFMPSALKKIEQYVRTGGQIQDYRNRPIFTPTPGETAGIALGFQPRRLTDFNAADRIATQAQANITRREGQFHQQQAEDVLKGNFGNVRAELLNKAQTEKNYDPIAGVRAVARAAEELTFPRDLRREGSLKAGDVRAKLLSTFNIPPGQVDETTRLQFRQNVERRLGLPVSSGSDLRLATVMDQLRRVNPEAARSDLRRQAELLLRAPRLQTLASPTE